MDTNAKSDRLMRGTFLLVAALVALLVVVANAATDGPDALTQVASAVMVVGGAVGAILLAWGLLRD